MYLEVHQNTLFRNYHFNWPLISHVILLSILRLLALRKIDESGIRIVTEMFINQISSCIIGSFSPKSLFRRSEIISVLVTR